jgi:hypothetical protein
VAHATADSQEKRKQKFRAQETFNTAKAQADATKAQADAEVYSISIKGKAQLDIQQRQGGRDPQGQPRADRLGARHPPCARCPAPDLCGQRTAAPR